jgi:hypothetical protein
MEEDQRKEIEELNRQRQCPKNFDAYVQVSQGHRVGQVKARLFLDNETWVVIAQNC